MKWVNGVEGKWKIVVGEYATLYVRSFNFYLDCSTITHYQPFPTIPTYLTTLKLLTLTVDLDTF